MFGRKFRYTFWKSPLLFSYGGDAYRPKEKSSYDSKWVKVPGVGNIKNCVCEGTDECVNCDRLLKELIKVLGFLNQVDLSKHPPGTGSNGSTCAGSTSGDGTDTTCPATENGTSCTYVVDEYGGKQVMVRVTCEPVKLNVTSSVTNGNTCYKKLIHEPVGFNGARAGDASGFRLGDVTCPNRTGGPFKVPYYSENGVGTTSNKSNHWRQPLVKVAAYFYDQDTDYKDPLLVVLEFQNGEGENNCKDGDGAGTVCEYYKLKASGPGMVWQKDNEASKHTGPEKIVSYLDSIRYDLKKVLKVDISCQGSNYKAMGRDGKPGTGNNGFQALNGNQVNVVECDTTCSKLASNNYKCYKHQLSNIIGFDYNLIAGVAFTIPGQGGEDIELKLYENGTTGGSATTCTNGKTGTPIQLTYNKCMGDVYVFFYGTGAGGSKPDTVPLMLWYNDSYYKPCDRESYFDKWIQVTVTGLNGQTPPCDGDVNGLVNKLNEVNRALNQIDLDKSKNADTGAGYGLPETLGGDVKPDPKQFSTMRVSLTKQEGPKHGPSQPPPPQPGTHAYVKVVHRTTNGFEIGPITYEKQDFADSGLNINGTQGTSGVPGEAIIKVKNGKGSNGNHNQLASDNKWNTVVAYYSSNDSLLKLPQLIVILKTDSEVKGPSDPVTASDPTYGYYILTNNGANKDYEYVWHPVNEQSVTLNDSTDFRLLNSIVILLDKKCKKAGNGTESYDDPEIKQAISKANLRSPGQDSDINRLKGNDKTINVTDETAGSGGSCLKQYGYKLCKHDFSSLVDIGGSLKNVLSNVKMISGLRFLIPTGAGGKYRQLILSESSDTRYLYYQNPNKTVSVYFYGKDPRPLLACYNGNAYKPIGERTYFYWWDKDTNISNCDCAGTSCGGCDKLIEKLVAVSNFLNRVDIKIIPRSNWSSSCYYQVHEFNGQTIRVKVELEPATTSFCYHKYTHTHVGTGYCKSDGTGFRLGTIDYGYRCIKENNSQGASGTDSKCITSALDKANPPKKYESADKVVVFYYQGDTKLERPLLVALCKNDSTNQCTVYYKLQKGDGASSNVKKYTKGTGDITLSDTPGGALAQTLDKILSENNYKLQIILDKRPTEMLYCNKPGANNSPPDICNKCDKCYEVDEKLLEVQCKIIKENCKNKPGCVLLCAGKSLCYQAQLYEPNNSQEKKGPTTTKPDVKVTPVKCDQLSRHGYKCYEHNVRGIDGVDQIGGLKFFLWDNTGGTECTTTGTSCTSSNSAATCKELCLYKPSSGDSSKEGTSSSCTATTATSPGTPSCTPDSKLQLVTTSYTTCKGNVYVYFYGDDPRPLMLC